MRTLAVGAGVAAADIGAPADVFLSRINGKHQLRHTSGYLGFDVRLEELTSGARNVIAIRVDASFGSGHWYEGGGLQRKVQLLHSSGIARLVSDGLFAQTAAGAVSAELATVVPTAEVVAVQPQDEAVHVHYALFDAANAQVAEAKTAAKAVHSRTAATIFGGATLKVSAPKLWSVRSPVLYRLNVQLLGHSGVLQDEMNVTVGLRSIDWSAEGFKLNEKKLHIRGFSHHSDFGAVGGAVPDRINLFRAKALRSVGGNWWRTSHNPYRPALYDILDATGVLVWDENRDFNQMNVQDMEVLVRRDRNHPSVVIWSACNEVECFVTGAANVTGALMRAAVKKWDTTRPFSANQNQVSAGAASNNTGKHLSAFLDVEGFSHGRIAGAGTAAIFTKNKQKAFISSECCSCQSQRGEDNLNASAGVVYPHVLSQAACMKRCMNISYPCWPDAGQCAGPKELDYSAIVSGTSGVWTLFDYGGEPGPWPTVSSSFGQFDYAGFAKSASYWYRALWLYALPATDYGRPPLPAGHLVRISQAWSKPAPRGTLPEDCDGQKLEACCPNTSGNRKSCTACIGSWAQKKNTSCGDVAKSCEGKNVWPDYCEGLIGPSRGVNLEVFSDLPWIEVFLNGKSGGVSPCTPGGFASNFSKLKTWKAGNLTAVGMKTRGGAALAHHTIITAGKATKVVLSLDVPSAATGTGTALLLDGHDSALVRATVVDAAGNVVADADHKISFKIASGPGRISGVHNGDAKSHEPQVATARKAYHGLARAAVKVTHDAVSNFELLSQIDVVQLASGTVKLGAPEGWSGAGEIVVTASASGLEGGKVSIPVSADEAMHRVLTVARRGLTDALTFD